MREETPNKIQTILDGMKSVEASPFWEGSRNEWMRSLSTTTFGTITEQLAEKVLGGTRCPNNRTGFDLLVEEKKVEIKANRVSIMNGRPMISWKNIRPSDPYTHILFIAIYPNDVRMFLVPRGDIPPESLKHSSGKKEEERGLFQIYSRKISDLPQWLTVNELSAP